MKGEIAYMLGIVAVGFVVNYALRALPFLLFAGRDREIPKWISRFGDLVSPVIIAALIFYSYSGLQWKTAWPYLAGALVVGLQVWRRNALLSIVAGTVVYMCLLSAGCATGPKEIVLDAAHPSIRYSVNGFLVGDRFVEPKRIPGMLESFDVPHDRVIHILVDEDAERDLKPARSFMGLLAHHGYSRSVLVSKKKTESHVKSEKEAALGRGRGGMTPPPPSSSTRGPQPARRQIRYKGAND
jgi:branched-subunit amino acid transport protein AzlD